VEGAFLDDSRVNIAIQSEDALAFLDGAIADKVAAGGGPVYLRTTEYEVSDTLSMADGVWLDGEDTTLTARAGFPATTPMVEFSGVQRGGFRGKVKLDCNDLAQSGLNIVNSSDVDFADGSLEIANVGDGGVSGSVWGVLVRENCQRITFDRPYIHDVWSGVGKIARGILVAPTTPGTGGPRACKIINATMEEIGPGDDGDGIVVQNFTDTADVQVLGGTFYRMYKRAVKFQSPGSKVKGITVINPFLGTGGVLDDVDPIVYSAVSAYANDCEIEGVTAIGGAWLHGIEIGAPGFVHEGIRVAGCNVVGGSGAVLTGFDGIRAHGTLNDSTIVDNRVKRARYGVHLSCRGKRIAVVGNNVDGVSVASTRGANVSGDPLTAITGVAATNLLAKTAHGMSAGNGVAFTTVTGGTGLTALTQYYVLASGLTADNFKLALTPGGTEIDFTTDVTAGTLVVHPDHVRFIGNAWGGVTIVGIGSGGGAGNDWTAEGNTTEGVGPIQNLLAPAFVPTVASAATLTLNRTATVQKVSGTTTVTALTSERSGDVQLDVLAACQFTDNGGTLNLAGNYTGPGTLRLYCDGTNWRELSRTAL
jgi:hypothetical protein